jgi:hypothetical protein
MPLPATEHVLSESKVGWSLRNCRAPAYTMFRDCGLTHAMKGVTCSNDA